MRISKFIAVTGAVTLCAGFNSVRAADSDNAAQAAARAAVLAAMQSNPPATLAPAVSIAPQPVVPASVVTNTAAVDFNSAPAQPVVPVANNAAQAAALAALNQTMQTTNVVVTTPNAPVATPMTVPVAMPAAPALPITASVADQLQVLNAKYQANQITPLDYFKQREAILKNQ